MKVALKSLTLGQPSLAAALVLACTTWGCSDPVPPAPKGAIAFSVRGCTTYGAAAGKQVTRETAPGSGMTETVYDNPSLIQAPPGNTAPWPGTRLKDGEAGAGVSCRVAGSDLFTVSGSFEGPSTLPGNSFGNRIRLEVSSGSLSEDAAGTGNITLSEPGGGYQGTGCTLSTVGSQLQVASGYVFASFDCPSMVRLSSPGGATCMSSGVFVFERCSE